MKEGVWEQGPYSNVVGETAREHREPRWAKAEQSHDSQSVLSFPLNEKWKKNNKAFWELQFALLFWEQNCSIESLAPSRLHDAMMRNTDNKPQNHDMRPTWKEQSGGAFPQGLGKCTRKLALPTLCLGISGGAWGIEFLLKWCTSTIMFFRNALPGKVHPAGGWEKSEDKDEFCMVLPG